MNTKNIQNIDENLTPYKKKSKRKPPRKAKHKHDFYPCVFEYDGMRLDEAHGLGPYPKSSIGSYCTICGKISVGTPEEYIRWVQTEDGFLHSEHTKAGKKELDRRTRTLPTFRIDDIIQQKFVKIDKGDAL